MLIRILLLLCVPAVAWAGEAQRPNGLVSQLIFWVGALAVVYLMSKMLFKEQFHERKTLRRLMHEIGPFYPEFHINAVTRWVHQCAPHVWNIYRSDELDSLEGFITENFRMHYREGGPKTLGSNGEKLILERVLKVHPLGIYMVDEVRPPSGVELMLRLEEKVRLVPAIAPPAGKKPRFTQVQTFWILRHERGGWKLDRVWEAKDDIKDMAERPQVPHVKDWMPGRSD